VLDEAPTLNVVINLVVRTGYDGLAVILRGLAECLDGRRTAMNSQWPSVMTPLSATSISQTASLWLDLPPARV
jgi:hypothetical protein